MEKEMREAVYDSGLRLEACRFRGLTRPFPNHFHEYHEYYVIGLVEEGARRLSCRGREYGLGRGWLFLFNPGDNHSCAQVGGGVLDYRSLHIAREVMAELAGEVTRRREPPRFFPNAAFDEEAAFRLRSLHALVAAGGAGFGKEEAILLLLSHLLQKYAQPFAIGDGACREEVERACAFMEEGFARRLTLDQLCRCAGLSRSALLRAFTRAKGVTPYSYLENIRVSKAMKLLESGLPPVETALRTGFSDQSHFTNCFTRFIGLSPGAYREMFLRKEEERDGLEG